MSGLGNLPPEPGANLTSETIEALARIDQREQVNRQNAYHDVCDAFDGLLVDSNEINYLFSDQVFKFTKSEDSRSLAIDHEGGLTEEWLLLDGVLYFRRFETNTIHELMSPRKLLFTSYAALQALVSAIAKDIKNQTPKTQIGVEQTHILLVSSTRESIDPRI